MTVNAVYCFIYRNFFFVFCQGELDSFDLPDRQIYPTVRSITGSRQEPKKKTTARISSVIFSEKTKHAAVKSMRSSLDPEFKNVTHKKYTH